MQHSEHGLEGHSRKQLKSLFYAARRHRLNSMDCEMILTHCVMYEEEMPVPQAASISSPLQVQTNGPPHMPNMFPGAAEYDGHMNANMLQRYAHSHTQAGTHLHPAFRNIGASNQYQRYHHQPDSPNTPASYSPPHQRSTRLENR